MRKLSASSGKIALYSDSNPSHNTSGESVSKVSLHRADQLRREEARLVSRRTRKRLNRE